MSRGNAGLVPLLRRAARCRAAWTPCILLAVASTCSLPAWGAWLQLGDGQVHDGVVYVPVIFDPAGDSVASLQFDVRYDAGRFAFAHAAPGPAAISAGKEVLPGARPDRLAIIVAGLNRTPLPAGVLAELYFEVVPDGAGDARITIGGVVMSDADGTAVEMANPAREGRRSSLRREEPGPAASTPSEDAAPGGAAPSSGEPGRASGGASLRDLQPGAEGWPDDGGQAAEGPATVLGGGTPNREQHAARTGQDTDGRPVSPQTGNATRRGGDTAAMPAQPANAEARHREAEREHRQDASRSPGDQASARPLNAAGEPMPSREQLAALRAAAERSAPTPAVPGEAVVPPRRTPLGALFLALIVLAAAAATLHRRIGNRNAPGRTIRG